MSVNGPSSEHFVASDTAGRDVALTEGRGVDVGVAERLRRFLVAAASTLLEKRRLTSRSIVSLSRLDILLVVVVVIVIIIQGKFRFSLEQKKKYNKNTIFYFALVILYRIDM
jgi:hypothetical protein